MDQLLHHHKMKIKRHVQDITTLIKTKITGHHNSGIICTFNLEVFLFQSHLHFRLFAQLWHYLHNSDKNETEQKLN